MNRFKGVLEALVQETNWNWQIAINSVFKQGMLWQIYGLKGGSGISKKLKMSSKSQRSKKRRRPERFRWSKSLKRLRWSWVSLQLEQKDDSLRFVSTTWALPTDWQLLAVLWLRLHLNVLLMCCCGKAIFVCIWGTLTNIQTALKGNFGRIRSRSFTPHY